MFSRTVIKQSRPFRAGGRKRFGAAAVECAVCLPMILALVFGTIEATNAVYLQRSLTTSAFEAGNVAAALGSDANNAVIRAKAVLSCLGVNGATINISPWVTPDTATGTIITVTCSAPLSSNTPTSWCLGNRTLKAAFSITHQ